METFIPDIIVYHAECPDGIAGAAILCYMGNSHTRLEAYMHNDDIPESLHGDLSDKNVILVDITFKEDIMDNLCSKCKNFTVLDHHASASHLIHKPYMRYSDLGKCGAKLAWDFMYSDYCAKNGYVRHDNIYPWWVDVIDARDRYVWTFPNSRELSEAMNRTRFVTHDGILDQVSSVFIVKNPSPEQICGITGCHQYKVLFKMGRSIMQTKTENMIVASRDFRLFKFRGYNVALSVSTSPTMRSDVGNFVCENWTDLATGTKPDFVVIAKYDVTAEPGKRVWHCACRSIGVDLVEAFKDYPEEHGGHPGASGITLKNLDEFVFVPSQSS